MRIEYGNIDFDKDVEDLKAMPKGEYMLSVYSHTLKLKRNKETGQPDPTKPYIEWQFLVTDGKYKGRKLFNNNSLQKKSLPYLKRFLKTVGFAWGKKFNPNENCTDVYGCEVIGRVDIRMYNNEERNDVTGFVAIK